MTCENKNLWIWLQAKVGELSDSLKMPEIWVLLLFISNITKFVNLITFRNSIQVCEAFPHCCLAHPTCRALPFADLGLHHNSPCHFPPSSKSRTTSLIFVSLLVFSMASFLLAAHVTWCNAPIHPVFKAESYSSFYLFIYK